MASGAYLVHDLKDAAVAQRVRMFAMADLPMRLAGFSRRAEPVPSAPGLPALSLGRTRDRRLGHRLVMTARAASTIDRWAPALAGAGLLVARNLEMLVIADRLRRRWLPGVPLIYECLDIHRLMVGDTAASAALRRIERRLLARSSALMVSSEDFLLRYFAPVQGWKGPTLLVENRVLAASGRHSPRRPRPRVGGPPWVIGWYGVIRCTRSLDILTELLRARPGQFELRIHGRPDERLTERLAAVRDLPGLHWLGPYEPARLPHLVSTMDFVWTIDYSDAGANSDWLLPNRLYSCCLEGAVPLALRDSATGRWLARHDAGLLGSGSVEEWERTLGAMSPDRYRVEAARVAAIPSDALEWDQQGCQALVSALLSGGPQPSVDAYPLRWI